MTYAQVVERSTPIIFSEEAISSLKGTGEEVTFRIKDYHWVL